jgi:hypothetical protein
MMIRGTPNLCFDTVVSEATERGLSAIVADALEFLVKEFDLSVPKTTIASLRAAASWAERVEMRLLADPTKATSSRATSLRALLDFRRREPGPINRSIARLLPAYLKSWAGVGRVAPALIVAAQATLGRPSWLRQILGRDCYRISPDITRLPKVGETLDLGDSEWEETALVAGWCAPESDGRWTYGLETTVAWCVQGQEQDLALLVDGNPGLHEKAPLQRIEIWVNDRRIASWRFPIGLPSSLPVRIPVPRYLFRNCDVLMLTFLIRRSGYEPGIDMRGLYIRSLRLLAEKNVSRITPVGGGEVPAVGRDRS